MTLKLLKNLATAGKLELFIDFANPDISYCKNFQAIILDVPGNLLYTQGHGC